MRVDDVRVETGPLQGDFIRADANGDFDVEISDPTFALTYLFIGGATPRCVDTAGTDDDGRVNITDSIYALNHLFLAGFAIRPPYPDCGTDPLADSLSCAERVCPP